MTRSLAPKSPHPDLPYAFTVTRDGVTLRAEQAVGYTTRWVLHWQGDLVGHVYRRPEGGYQARLAAGTTVRGGSAVEAVERLVDAMQRRTA